MGYRDQPALTGVNLLRTVYMVGSAVVLQLYLKSLGASPFAISLLEVAFWSGLFVFSPLWGALSDASGRRKIFLLVSFVGAAAVLPLFPLLTDTAGVLGLRFGFAIIAAAFPPVALAAMSAGAHRADRGKRIAPYMSSRAIGFMIGWGGSGLLVEQFGFGGAFWAFAGVGAVGLVVGLFIRGIDAPEPVTAREVWRKAKHRWLPSVRDGALREHGLHYLYLGIFIRKAGVIGIMSLFAVYAVDVLTFREALVGVLLGINPLTQLLFIDLFGRIADRYGRRAVFLLGFLCTLPFPVLLLVGTSPAVVGLGFVFLGFSFAALVQGSTAFIGDIAPDQRQGEFMGFRKASQGLAGIVGPLLAGAVATVYGYGPMLMTAAVLVTAGTVVVWLGTEESLGADRPRIGHDLVQYGYGLVGRDR